MNIDFWMQLPGRGEVRVEAEMNPPEGEVGIRGWWADDFQVFNGVGDDITQSLTEAEDDAVATKCSDIAEQRAYQRFEEPEESAR